MKIAVIGSGYVGLVTSVCFAEIGHHVISVDNDSDKISSLQAGEVPIHEQFLKELISRHHGSRLSFSDDLSLAVASSEIIFIAVGTPASENGEADLSYVESVAREIAHSLDGFRLIVEKSTVPVCTNEWIQRSLVREGASEDFFEVVSNPEFLREGTAITDFLYPDRIVIGVTSERSCEIMHELYEPLVDGTYRSSPEAVPAPDASRKSPPLIVTSPKSAELIKHISNAFLAMKISFINAAANICEAVGADITQVCRGIGADSRIGDRFLRPGIGYGGSCFPKDLLALRSVARECGYDFRLLDEVIHINEDQRTRFLRKVRNALWTLKRKRLGVLGLAFKGGTDDIRESPAMAIVDSLSKEGCSIAAYDPAAMKRARAVFPTSEMCFASSAYEAADGADALVILTDWEEFGQLDLERLRSTLKYPLVIDGRNLYDPGIMAAAGFTYCSIGRPDASPIGRSAFAT